MKGTAILIVSAFFLLTIQGQTTYAWTWVQQLKEDIAVLDDNMLAQMNQGRLIKERGFPPPQYGQGKPYSFINVNNDLSHSVLTGIGYQNEPLFVEEYSHIRDYKLVTSTRVYDRRTRQYVMRHVIIDLMNPSAPPFIAGQV